MPLSSYLVFGLGISLVGLAVQTLSKRKKVGQILVGVGLALFTAVAVTIAITAGSLG